MFKHMTANDILAIHVWGRWLRKVGAFNSNWKWMQQDATKCIALLVDCQNTGFWGTILKPGEVNVKQECRANPRQRQLDTAC